MRVGLKSGIWGTVCGDGVTDNTAIVVCNQLGYSLHSKL